MSDLIDRAQDNEANFIDDSLNAVQRELLKQQSHESSLYCCDCDGEIPEARRLAVKGVLRCIDCQLDAEYLEKTRGA